MSNLKIDTNNFRNYAIFASGEGSNALSLIRKGLELKHPPQFLLCNVEEAPILKKASSLGIKTYFVPSLNKGLDSDFENELIQLCRKNNVEWVFLAGFLKILSANFLKEFTSDSLPQVLNIHPSLLPLYPGLGGYKKAYHNGDEFFGHTIHFVTEGVDEGPHILQRKFKRETSWGLDELIDFGKEMENKSYSKVLETLVLNGFKKESLSADSFN